MRNKISCIIKQTLLAMMITAITLATTSCHSRSRNLLKLPHQDDDAQLANSLLPNMTGLSIGEEQKTDNHLGFLKDLKQNIIEQHIFNKDMQYEMLNLTKEHLKTAGIEGAEEIIDFWADILKQQTIWLEVKVLQELQKILCDLCKSNRGKKGVGPIKDFIKFLKGYVPRKRDYHNDSAGESESDDPNVVYRALTSGEVASLENDPNIGIFAKGKNKLFKIIEHVSPMRGKSQRDQSPWISTTRSLKVAGAWASESDCKVIVKIKIGAKWPTQTCDHPELGHKRCYDFTKQADCSLFFPTNTSERNTTFASQEVIIYRKVPRANIIALYTAEILSDEQYAGLKAKSPEELIQEGIYSMVKTRKETQEYPKARVIKIKR